MRGVKPGRLVKALLGCLRAAVGAIGGRDGRLGWQAGCLAGLELGNGAVVAAAGIVRVCRPPGGYGLEVCRVKHLVREQVAYIHALFGPHEVGHLKQLGFAGRRGHVQGGPYGKRMASAI
eukprot:scaffold315521_cov33-Prasinocladus_malaysianus.AAC.1